MKKSWSALLLTSIFTTLQLTGLPNQKPSEAVAHCRIWHPHHCTIREVVKDVGKTVDRWGLAVAHPALTPIPAYLEFLFQQGNKNGWKGLPDDFKACYKSYYSYNLDDVKYATNIDTVHGSAITVDDRIYFPTDIDLTKRSNKHWILHEMEHIRQYKAVGGVSAFMVKYVAQGGIKIGSKGSFKIHDDIQLEGEAESKADRVVDACSGDSQSQIPPTATTETPPNPPSTPTETPPQSVAACSSTYDPRPYRPGTSRWNGRVGQIAFNNGTSTSVKVTLFHPDAPATAFNSWNVQPGQNLYLGGDNYGMDWGIQVNDSPICIVGSVSDWNSFNGSHIFQTWVERISR
jgi:Domain of unknown function (DUF4157)